MKFEEITFFPAAVEGKTFKEFCEHEKHWKLPKEKMKEIFDILKKTNKPVDVKADVELEVPPGDTKND